jgi:hypothetical protein
VCVPNAEPISNAAELFVARFRGSAEELQHLSPFAPYRWHWQDGILVDSAW